MTPTADQQAEQARLQQLGVKLTPEQERELNELHAFCLEAAEIEASPWQPRCISGAFAKPGSKLVLTYQRWIDLDAIRSPLLLHKAPENIEQLAAAMTVFGIVGEIELTPEQAASIVLEMLEAIAEAFSTVLEMKLTEKAGDGTESRPEGGFGVWMPLFAALITQYHFTRLDALACPVAQSFAIMSASKYNAGWHVFGNAYIYRDLEDKEVAEPAAEAVAPASEQVLTEPQP